MRRTAISVTLTSDNVAWLRAHAASIGSQSVSRALDELISEARARTAAQPVPVRSVANTISIPTSDKALADADAAVRGLFDRSGTRRRRPTATETRATRRPRGRHA